MNGRLYDRLPRATRTQVRRNGSTNILSLGRRHAKFNGDRSDAPTDCEAAEIVRSTVISHLQYLTMRYRVRELQSSARKP